MRYFVLFLPCLALAGTACQRDATDRTNRTPIVSTVSTPDAPLRDTRWVLRQVGGQPIAAPAAAEPAPYLLISGAGTAEGNGSCNRFRGGLKPATDDGQLQFNGLASTRMACPAQATEQQFMQALEGTRYYRISGNTLSLYADAERTGTPLAELAASPQP